MEKPICYSHIGKRPNHEDSSLINGLYLISGEQKKVPDNCCCFVTDDTRSKIHLLTINDGMGGYDAGEVTSRIYVKRLAETGKVLQNCSYIEEVIAYLQPSIAEINAIVREKSRSHGKLEGTGATLVLFVIRGMGYAILDIGDGRVYHFSNNALTQITRGHTEGQRMLDLGLLTREELSDFPARKDLNRHIGYGQDGYVLQADGYYLILDNGVMFLYNDGISDYLSDSRILEILHSVNNLESADKQPASEAIASHNTDNVTVMLIPLRR